MNLVLGHRILLISLLMVVFLAPMRSQEDRQKQLEEQRRQLEIELNQMNKLLSSSRQEKLSALSQVENLDQKIRKREKLIRLTNEEADYLNKQINTNQRTITKQREELEKLKADYAKIILRSYKSRSEQNRLMFLLSSKDLFQAYRRAKYMEQYAQYRRKQGVEIAQKTQTLQELNLSLSEQRKKKQILLDKNRQEKQKLESERKSQNSMVASLRKQENTYAKEIRKKQQEAERLEEEIQRLIAAAIAESNRKAGTSSASFALTPEAQLLADNFNANKGRLPWPVKEGVVIQGFGTQRHPVVHTTMIKSNGVQIATNTGEKVRAVFEGKVLSVGSFKGSNTFVLIQHGNYITSYKNLTKVIVREGDKVEAKEVIGEVFTDSEGKTVLQFAVFKNSNPENPAGWIYQM